MTATAPEVTKSSDKPTADMEAALAKVNERYASRFLVFNFKSNDDGSLVFVHRRAGPNASDKRPLGVGLTIVPTDVRKFVDANETGAENLIGALDGSSWRVQADAVVREAYEDGKKIPGSLDEICDMIWSRIQGIRAARAPRTHALPDGNRYSGNDLAEYRQEYQKAMELMGAQPALAEAIASKITF